VRVLVTGGAGFIGANLARRLLDEGHQVVVLDDLSTGRAANLDGLAVDVTEGSVLDGGLLDRLMGDADRVVHLAARASVPRSIAEPVATHAANATGTLRVLEAARPASVPVVVASSSSVYGGAGSRQRPHACHEDDGLRPLGGYARSKRVLEQRCARRLERSGMVGVVRPFTVAGEGQRPDMAISTWIDALRSGRPVRLFGSGARRRDVTDVRDVAEGIARMLERRATSTVNLGTGTSHRLDHLLATVARVCGADPAIAVEPALAEDVAATRADVGRCADLLGFVPLTDLPALIARQMAAAEIVVHLDEHVAASAG
jgi:nucleoside-diphosphate-sugar epimerase